MVLLPITCHLNERWTEMDSKTANQSVHCHVNLMGFDFSIVLQFNTRLLKMMMESVNC